jgi:hypothetical protein
MVHNHGIYLFSNLATLSISVKNCLLISHNLIPLALISYQHYMHDELSLDCHEKISFNGCLCLNCTRTLAVTAMSHLVKLHIYRAFNLDLNKFFLSLTDMTNKADKYKFSLELEDLMQVESKVKSNEKCYKCKCNECERSFVVTDEFGAADSGRVVIVQHARDGSHLQTMIILGCERIVWIMWLVLCWISGWV